MRQSDKCGSVRNDHIFNLQLGSSVGPSVSILCLSFSYLLIRKQDWNHEFLEYPKNFDVNYVIHLTWKSTEIFIVVVTHKDLLVLKLKIKDCSFGN